MIALNIGTFVISFVICFIVGFLVGRFTKKK